MDGSTADGAGDPFRNLRADCARCVGLCCVAPAFAASAAAFDDLTRSAGIKDESLGAWPNAFRTHRFVPAVEYIRAQRARTLLTWAARDNDRTMLYGAEIKVAVP